MPNFSLSLFFLFLGLLSPCSPTLTLLRVTLSDPAINSVGTHTWSVTYSNSIGRSEFSLNFPSCVTPQPNVFVTHSTSTTNVTAIGANSITFTLSPSVAATSYTFGVGNVKNCFRALTTKSFSIFNKEDNLLESFPSMVSVIYSEGLISGCQLSYLGFTGDVPSTLKLDFRIQNPVVSGFSLRLQYPVYFSSSLELTSYNNPSAVPNYALGCQLSRNGAVLGTSVNAVITFSNKSILCPFVLPGGVSIATSDSLALSLLNVTNPKTSTLYAGNTDFILTTLDSAWFTYDKSAACLVSPVPVAQFQATFSQTQVVNSGMYPMQLATGSFVPVPVSKNDKILLRYSTGEIVSCSGRIFVDKSSGLSPIIFSEQSTNINMAKLYLSNGSSDANNTLSIEFEGCSFSMPSSTTPIDFTLVFSGTGTTVGTYDDYMQVNAQLVPLSSTLLASQVDLSLSVASIGDLSTYTFGIRTGQPLSQTPNVLIDFPAQVIIATAIATLSSCNVMVGSLGIGSRSCVFVAPNSILVSLTYTAPIPSGTRLQVSLHNIQNPSSPSSVNGFNIRTYYTSSEPLGLVEVGSNVIASQLYVARKVYPQVLANNYTVYTSGTQVTIVYPVGVDLPAGSTCTLTFTSVLKNIAFQSVNSTLVTLSTNNGVAFQFSLAAIPSGTNIAFVFSCLTPASTGIYSVVDILTTAGGLEYQKTVTSVTFEVVSPFSNAFKASPNPAEAITGKVTYYTFYFQSVVPHPGTFILEVSFPATTNLMNGQAACLSGCSAASNFSDTSSGLLDRIELLVSAPASGCTNCYQVRVSMIRNQREVGPTGTFSFRTLTTSRQSILAGTATTSITTPNSLVASLPAVDDYYRGNTNPVHVQINVTNKLEVGDVIVITSLSNSYMDNSAISCAEGACTGTRINSVTFELRALPTASQVIEMSISLQIYGLVSSSTTLYGEQFAIQVATYSSSLRPIDSGTMMYSVDCSDIASKNCKTCSNISGQGVCTSCYTPIYSLFNNSLCTNACGNVSQYETYPNSGVCVPCTPPCLSCLDSTNCTTCISGFYLIVGQNVCLSSCNTSNGYYSFTSNDFLYCKTCTEPFCKSCPRDICDACQSSWVLLNGKCQGGCAAGTFNAGGVCSLCDRSCLTCDGPANTNCFNCSVGYSEIDGQCTSSCPTGKVNLLDGTCGCSGDCASCISLATKCLSCLEPSKFYFNYICYTACPASTYAIGQTCLSCTSGCLRCSSTTCVECLNGASIFENKCYYNCKEVGPRYTSMLVSGVLRCDQCPDGCSECDETYKCTECLASYSLNGTVCKRACEATNTCDITPKVDPVIPLPGFLTFAIWCLVVALVKIFLIKGVYVPYTLLFGGALIQFVILAASLGSVDAKIKSLASARLLQTQTLSNEVLTALGLLIVAMALNYLMNAIALWVFCQYIRPMILPRQVDRISNYAVLAVSLLTNHRFYLLAFSRLFKKPYIEVKDPDKLRNLHIILGVSYILDAVALAAGFMLALKTTKLSILNMLGIDLILLICLLWVIFVWVLVRPKPEDYYSETKKFSLQENHITEEGSMQNNEKDMSKAKIHNLTNEQLQVEDYNGEENADNLPTMQANLIKVGKKSESIEGQPDPKTKRKTKADGALDAINKNKLAMGSHREGQKREPDPSDLSQLSEGKEREEGHKETAEKHIKSERKMESSSKKIKDEVFDFDEDSNEKQLKREVHHRSTKLKGQRSSTMKMEQGDMRKKNHHGTFESEIADSNIDDVDLQSIIQTRLVDRSKDKQPRDARTEAGGNEDRAPQFEEISPSWFNIQNQRYDIEDKELQ